MSPAEAEYVAARADYMAAHARLTAARAVLTAEYGEAIPMVRHERAAWTAARAAELGVPQYAINTLAMASPVAQAKKQALRDAEQAHWDAYYALPGDPA